MNLDKRLKVLQPVVACSLILVSIMGSLIPYAIKRAKNFKIIMSYVSCAAGGILAAVALLHIIPDAGLYLNPAMNNFPMSFCIIFIGIITMLFILKLGGTIGPAAVISEAAIRDTITCSEGDVHKLPEEKEWKTPDKKSYGMLFLGLIIHDLSEGIMLGLQTNYEHVIYLSIALILHKWCESCCQVVQGINNGVDKKTNLLVSILLSVASPISQMTAFIIMRVTNKTQISNALYYTQGVFMSFAAGTFITIILVEILSDELESISKKELSLKTGAIIGGFLFMSCCSMIEYMK